MSTLPFLALIAALGLLAVAIAVVARPGQRPFQPKRQPAAEAKSGTAPPGWYEEAEREMH